jgi:hypothetical protein
MAKNMSVPKYAEICPKMWDSVLIGRGVMVILLILERSLLGESSRHFSTLINKNIMSILLYYTQEIYPRKWLYMDN